MFYLFLSERFLLSNFHFLDSRVVSRGPLDLWGIIIPQTALFTSRTSNKCRRNRTKYYIEFFCWVSDWITIWQRMNGGCKFWRGKFHTHKYAPVGVNSEKTSLLLRILMSTSWVIPTWFSTNHTLGKQFFFNNFPPVSFSNKT